MFYKSLLLPYGNDVRKQKNKTEHVSVPRSTKAFQAHHNEC